MNTFSWMNWCGFFFHFIAAEEFSDLLPYNLYVCCSVCWMAARSSSSIHGRCMCCTRNTAQRETKTTATAKPIRDIHMHCCVVSYSVLGCFGSELLCVGVWFVQRTHTRTQTRNRAHLRLPVLTRKHIISSNRFCSSICINYVLLFVPFKQWHTHTHKQKHKQKHRFEKGILCLKGEVITAISTYLLARRNYKQKEKKSIRFEQSKKCYFIASLLAHSIHSSATVIPDFA